MIQFFFKKRWSIVDITAIALFLFIAAVGFEKEGLILIVVLAFAITSIDVMIRNHHNLDMRAQIEELHTAFNKIQAACPHYDEFDHDCHHPDLDFCCMNCGPENCPLL